MPNQYTKLVPGKNDFASLLPEIAKEAYGWDPSTVSIGSNKKKEWICKLGHIWEMSPKDRKRGRGCSICASKKIIIGTNDLASQFSKIAEQAYEWDPSKIMPGNHDKKKWICSLGHIWEATPKDRTQHNTDCPYCTNQKVLTGFNDLKTKSPEIAEQAYGWDPQKVLYGSKIKKKWKCKLGHTWQSVVYDRSSKKTDCPYCSNKKHLKGFNDLETRCPEVAAEAYKWDPSKIMPGNHEKKKWICSLGHIWEAEPALRTFNKTGCPYCSNHKVLEGFNDLETRCPEVAAEAYKWDPSKIMPGDHEKKNWICSFGHIWEASPNSRTNTSIRGGSGCPECSETGFKKSQSAWIYLMEREGEQQIGISNNLQKRMQEHGANGWEKLDSIGPYEGDKIYETEKKFKQWLKKEIGLIQGTTENWKQINLQVKSLKELKLISGIKTDLF